MPHPDLPAPHHAASLAGRLLAQERFIPLADLAIEAWCSAEPLPFARRREGAHRHLAPGEPWGRLFDCAWFRFTGRVPEQAGPLVALLDVNGELLVVDEAGEPLRGLTNQASTFDPALGKAGKHVLPLDGLVPGTAIEIWADAGANDLFGELKGEGRVVEARLALLRPEVETLAYDLELLADLEQALPAGEPGKARLATALRQAVQAWDGSAASAVAARAILAPELARRGPEDRFTVSAIGHAHLDLAWLWPLRETRRKAARTLATVLATQERHPDYVFGLSQPQQLAWIAEDHPGLFARVRTAMAAGRIECQGGMWVEPDTNLLSAESLARQLLHGQRTWQTWSGRRARTCWLPDAFGFSAVLPQLLRQAGIDWFMTTKLSWNQVNRFPRTSFRWRSPDGSEVLAHLPPEGTYNSPARPASLLACGRQHRDAGASPRALLPFGIGDGGGGPGEEHLARLERCRDLAGLPRVVQEPAEAFFARLEEDRPRLAAWEGELYLEKHQGTFTTQGRMKRLHRRLEWALQRTEIACARAWLAGAAWPGERLDAIWKEVLLHQFHDILPGSSIRRVYVEAETRSEALLAELAGLCAEADRALPAGPQVVNDLAWERHGWIEAADGWRRVTVPGLAAAPLPAPEVVRAPTPSPTGMENGRLRLRLAPDGRLASLVDLEQGREVLEGPGNDLLLFDDPGDAWDFPLDYPERRCERPRLTDTRCTQAGPEGRIEQTWRCGASTITCCIVLAAGSRRVEFRIQADWRERRRMLRVRFPVALRAECARCEIALGSIARPTHANTSWEAARSEVPVHSWVDLSERGYGTALLNDGRYGHRLAGNILDLALLRSPVHPDPEADQGRHAFTYALFPHPGDHNEGRVLEEAHDLNQPLRLAEGGGGRATPGPLLGLDQPGVVVTAIKRGEEDGHLVVRLAEAQGARRRLRLTCAVPLREARNANLLEDAGELLDGDQGGIDLTLAPWTLRTLLLTPSLSV